MFVFGYLYMLSMNAEGVFGLEVCVCRVPPSLLVYPFYSRYLTVARYDDRSGTGECNPLMDTHKYNSCVKRRPNRWRYIKKGGKITVSITHSPRLFNLPISMFVFFP